MIMNEKNHEEEVEVVEDDTVEEETSEEATEDTEEDSTDWKAKADELQGRLKRAETKLSKGSSNKTASKPSKSNDLDYGAKAYLASHDLKVKGTKEIEFVENELKQSGQDLDSLLENDYFKGRLEDFRKLDKTSEATPKGKRSGGAAIDSVDYWMTKPMDEVPADMRIKVVNARLDKETKKGVFYNS